MNKASEKDNYLVPPREFFFQRMSGAEMFSLLDGSSGYNQVLVSHNDLLSITYRTLCGTYAYKNMPFGLINVGATFQRDMDIAFRGLMNECVVVYLDDVTIYSKNIFDHVRHLRHIFERYRKYGLSLSPKKIIFRIIEGKLLGFIISKEGIMIDPKRTKATTKIPPTTSKKSMQSFFVRRFVSDFVETVKPLQELVKKNTIF